MNQILIKNGTIITMNPDREIIESGSVLIKDNKIAQVSKDEIKVNNDTCIIDANRKVILPGLIDCHTHAGHTMVKSLGVGKSNDWVDACLKIYSTGSSLSFWETDASLSALEKIKAGVTSSLILFGGGTDLLRSDKPDYAVSYAKSFGENGIKGIVAVGPNRPPYPTMFYDKENNTPVESSLDNQLEVTAELVSNIKSVQNNRVSFCVSAPKFFPEEMDDENLSKSVAYMYDKVMDLRSQNNLIFTQDGHKEGSISISDKFNALGEWALLSHSITLSNDDLKSIKKHKPTIVHNPSSNYSIMGRCPVPELLDDGIRVVIGSDGAAPDRGFDMFRHMSQCMHYHRRHFEDTTILPPGKVLEMVTIDAAEALGLGSELGSIETGKVADIILIDMFKPHLLPMNMPVTRLAHYANAADVNTVIVNGEIVMMDRNVLKVNELDILEKTEEESIKMLSENNLNHLTNIPDNFWKKSRL